MTRHHRPTPGVMGSAMIILLTAAAFAVAGGDYEVPWSTVDGGGGESSGATFTLTGTIGQPDAHSGPGRMTGSTDELEGGFWTGAADTGPPCPSDTDGDDDVDVDDLVNVILAWGTADPAADVDDDADVDVDDLVQVILDWGPCT